ASSEKERLQKLSAKEFGVEFLKIFSKHFVADSVALWRYFTANQAQAEQEKNWLAARQRMREVIERPIRMALIDTKLPLAERKKLFNRVANLVVQTEEDTPFETMASGSQLMD